MNWRNRKLVITLRVLFGLFMVFSGVAGLMTASSLKGVPENMIPIMQVFSQTGILYLAKIVEIVAGLMLVFGIFPALAALAFVPLTIGIVIINANVAPESLLLGIIVFLLNLYFIYVYYEKYKAILKK